MPACIFVIESPLMHSVGFTFTYLGFGTLLALVVDKEPASWIRPLILPLAWLGTYSYSVYLWHMVLVRLLPHDENINFWLNLTLAISLGVLSAKLVEFPVLRLREKWVSTRRV